MKFSGLHIMLSDVTHPNCMGLQDCSNKVPQLSGLTTNLFSYSSGSKKSEIKVQQSQASSEEPKGVFYACLLASGSSLNPNFHVNSEPHSATQRLCL